MILYSDRDDHYSQRVRIVLAEKDIAAEIKEVSIEETPDDILSISPYQKKGKIKQKKIAKKGKKTDKRKQRQIRDNSPNR